MKMKTYLTIPFEADLSRYQVGVLRALHHHALGRRAPESLVCTWRAAIPVDEHLDFWTDPVKQYRRDGDLVALIDASLIERHYEPFTGVPTFNLTLAGRALVLQLELGAIHGVVPTPSQEKP